MGSYPGVAKACYRIEDCLGMLQPADMSRSVQRESLFKIFSGWYILNICMHAIHAGSMDQNPERWKVTQLMLKREIAKAKSEH
jgi:hypothetical protein